MVQPFRLCLLGQLAVFPQYRRRPQGFKAVVQQDLGASLMLPAPASEIQRHGSTFGIAPVTSTSRNMPPTSRQSRTQSSAWHQSS